MDNLGVAMNATTIEAYALSKGIETSYAEMDNAQKVGLAMEMFLEKTAYAAGNYAKENETLAGSLSTARAAMSDFLSGAGNVDDLVESFSNAGDVVIKNLQSLLPRMTTGLTSVVRKLAPKIPALVGELAPPIVEGATALMTGFVGGILDNLPMLADAARKIVSTLADGLGEAVPVLKPVMAAVSFLSEHLETLGNIALVAATGFVAFKAAVAIQGIITGVTAAIGAAAAVTELYAAGAGIAAVSSMALGTGTTVLGTVMAVLTGKLSLATAAQWLLNTAISANPVGVFIASVAALVVGLGLLVNWVNRETKEQKALKESTKEVIESNKALLDTLAESEKAYEENVRGILSNADASETMANKIFELSAAENKSAADKKRLLTMVEALNDAMPELNLQYDEQTDALNLSKEAIYAQIEAQKEAAKQQLVMERGKEILKEEIRLQEELAVATEKYNEVAGAIDNLSFSDGLTDVFGTKSKALAKDAKELEETIQQLTGELADNARQSEINADAQASAAEKQISSVESVTVAVKTAQEIQAEIAAQRQADDDALTEKLIENANAQGLTLDEYKAKLKETEAEEAAITKEREATLQKYTDLALDMFNKIETKSKISVTAMAENLEHNQKVIDAWGDNILALEGKVDRGLLDKLKEAGPESAATVNALVNASDKELERLNTVFASGGQVATDALMKQLGLPEVVDSGAVMVDEIADGVTENKSLEDAMQKLVAASKKKADEQVKTSNFPETGINMVKGIIVGVKSQAAALYSAVSDMMAGSKTAAKKAIESNSPSKLFEREVGVTIPQGVEKGVVKDTPKAVKAAEKMATETYGAAKLWIESYRNDEDYLASEELKMWEYLGTRYADKTKQRVEADKNAAKLRAQIAKEEAEAKKKADEDSFNFSKKWIETKKFFGLINAQEELDGWLRIQARYNEGTEQRMEADRRVFELEKQLYSEREGIVGKMEDAEKKYTDAVASRADAIFRTFGLFDELKKKEDSRADDLLAAQLRVSKLQEELRSGNIKGQLEYTQKQNELTKATAYLAQKQEQANKTQGQILADNLRSQVEEMRSWTENIRELSERGINDGLLAELQKMGPSANAEIEALTTMTDDELSVYSDLWGEKYKLAREQAVEELAGLREDVDAEISALQGDLDKTFESAGVDAGRGLVEGVIDGIHENTDKLLQTAATLGKEFREAMGDTSAIGGTLEGLSLDASAAGSVSTVSNMQGMQTSTAAPGDSRQSLLEMVVAALEQGFSMVSDTILAALPDVLQFYFDTSKVAETTWSAYDNEAGRRNRMFAPTRDQIAAIARSVMPTGDFV